MYILILHRAKKKKKMKEINKHPKENEDKEIGRYDRVVGNYYINIINAISV